MSQYILIDGENFVHAAVHILRTGRLISSRDELRKIDIATLLKTIPEDPERTVQYYMTRIHLPPQDSPLYEKVEYMRDWNTKWIPYLANQKVKCIKAGILKVRSGKRCPYCQNQSDVLLEKGVDVRLGVDIVSMSQAGAEIYIMTSDSDIIPAIVNARKLGASVTYVTFEGNVNQALSKSASRTLIIKKTDVLAAFRKAHNDGKA